MLKKAFRVAIFLLIVASALFAAPTVIYGPGQTANFTAANGVTVLATMKLLNPINANNEFESYMPYNCEMGPFNARVCIKITPLASATLTKNTNFTSFVVKSNIDKTSTIFNKVVIYESREIQENVPFFSNYTILYNITNNDTHITSQVPYTYLVENGTTLKKYNVTAWYPFNTANIVAGKEYILGFEYTRKNPKDVSDLVISFLNLNTTKWAWWNVSVGYKVPVTCNTTVATTATNYPCYAAVDHATMVSAGHSNANASCMWVVDPTETMAVNFEIVKNTNGTSAMGIYYAANTSASANTTSYLYYDVTCTINAQNPVGLWRDAGYVIVYHFAGDTTDSAGYTNLSTNGVGCGYNTQKRGGGITLASNCHIGNNATVGLPTTNGAGTVTAWFNKTSGTTYNVLFSYNEGVTAGYGFILGVTGGVVKAADGNAWYGGAVNYDSTMAFYGINTSATAMCVMANASWSCGTGSVRANTGKNLNMPSFSNSAYWSTYDVYGTLAEFRIRNQTSTTDWVTAEYAQNYYVGAEEEATVVEGMENATITDFLNATNSHSFLINATVDDFSGGSAVRNVTVIANYGTCTHVSNSSSGNKYKAMFNCSYSVPANATLYANFSDTTGNYTNATNHSYYPDNGASLTPPTITPATAYVNTTLTCNAGSYSDADGDAENASARTWAWYKNGAVIAGQTAATLDLTAISPRAGDNISCAENATNSTWVGSFAWNMSTNRTLANMNASCRLISRIPTNITSNSTGLFEVIINCSDADGINANFTAGRYRAFATRTVDGQLTLGLPNRWSVRYPDNSKAQLDPDVAYQIYGKVLRAFDRGKGYWFDYLNYTTTLNLDNFSYAVNDGNSGRFNITNTSTTEAIINYTGIVDMTFRQNFYLDYSSMVNESKKNASISFKNPILVKKLDWEAARNSSNYTMNIFRNMGYKASPTPTKVLSIYYCNSSYDPAGSTQPIASPNCINTNNFLPVDINVVAFSDKNSSYFRSSRGVINGHIGTVKTTPYYYIEYESATNSEYYLRYANGSTDTNVTFAQTNVAWTSTDSGTTWVQANWTPDTFVTSTKANNDIFEFGVYIEDNAGSPYMNLTIFSNDIGPANHQISHPAILQYNSTLTQNDTNLSGTHTGIMQILISPGSDPDSNGTVTHNLTLLNPDGTWNYTINSSFTSPNDGSLWLDFNTSLVPQFHLYRMQVDAVSVEDPSDIKNMTTVNNFTIYGCGNLDTPNRVYTLITNLSSGPTCFSVNATNITIECAGYSITGMNTSVSYGISSNNSNTSIVNCKVSNFTRGIYLSEAADFEIYNTSSHGSGYGIYAYLSNRSYILNTTGYSDKGVGIYINQGFYGLINNSTGSANASAGIYFYMNSYSNITNSTATSSAWSGIIIEQGTKNGVYNSITTSTSQYGIWLASSSYNTIVNISSSSAGTAAVYMGSSTGNFITNSTILSSASGYGIWLDASSYTNITNSIIVANSSSGVYLLGYSTPSIQYDLFANNTISSNSTAVKLGVFASDNYFINNTFSGADILSIASSSFSNLFYWNNFTNASGAYVVDLNGSNYFNSSTEGNVWFNVINGSVGIFGNTPSSGYPALYIGSTNSYSNSTSIGKFSCNFTGCQDNFPLTDERIACKGATKDFLCGENVTESCSLMANVIGLNGCFNITAPNIVLNCAGNSITGGNATDTYGINSNSTNTTVANCTISNFSTGIFYYNQANFGTIINTTVITSYSNGEGIQFYETNNNTVSNSTFMANTGEAILVYTGDNNTFHEVSAIATTGVAYQVYYGHNNTIYNSNLTSNAGRAVSITSYSLNNVVRDNHIAGNDDTYGAFSVYYGINNSIIANNTIDGGGGDYAMTFQNEPCRNNSIINNTLINATTLVWIDANSFSNIFYWNNFSEVAGTVDYYLNDENGSNYYNTTEGNVWKEVVNGTVQVTGASASTGYPTLYVGGSGIGYPYNQTGTTKFLCGFSSCADYAPLAPTYAGCVGATTTFNCGDSITESCALSGDIAISGTTCFNVAAPNVAINCNNSKITGSGAANRYAIYSNQANTVIGNCTFVNWKTDINLDGAGTPTVANSNFGSEVGLLLNASTGGTYSNLNFTNITEKGIWATTGSTGNIFRNITVINGSTVWAYYTDGASDSNVFINFSIRQNSTTTEYRSIHFSHTGDIAVRAYPNTSYPNQPLDYKNLSIFYEVINNSAATIILNMSYTNADLASIAPIVESNLQVMEVSPWCYQETANISTGCGGLNTGNYRYIGVWNTTAQRAYLTDGNWATNVSSLFGAADYIYINYTKPTGASENSFWKIKDINSSLAAYEAVNLTIPAGCFAQSTLQFYVIADYNPIGYVGWGCYNGTSWQSLRYERATFGVFNYAPYVFEEAMWWYFPNTTNRAAWSNLTSTVDAANNIVSASSSYFSPFAPMGFNAPPTEPTTDTLLPAVPVITDTLTATCAGSTDAESEVITYYYAFYDINDSAYRTAFSTTNTYILVPGIDSHDDFRVDCYAADPNGNSTTHTGTTIRTISNTVPTTANPDLSPIPAYKSTPVINCTNNTTSDIDLDAVTFTYLWFINGSPTAITTFNISNSSFYKGDSLVCQITPYDGYGYGTAKNSSALVISNLGPTVVYQLSFVNYSIGHAFNVSAGVYDLDGAPDIASTNISTTSGACSQLANVSIGNYFNVTYNCSATAPGTASIIIGFTDLSGSYTNTSEASNKYPDNAPTINQPTLNSPLNASATGTCTAATIWTDIDGDVEDAASRVWAWYLDGSLVVGSTGSTALMTTLGATRGHNVSCRENVTAVTWTTFNATNLSSNVTLINSPPTTAVPNLSPIPAYTNSTITCSNNTTSDMDGDTVTFYYDWYVNNTLTQSGTANTFNGTYFDHGDNVTCKITPWDGYDNGTAQNFSEIISNSAPVLVYVEILNDSTSGGFTFNPGNLYGHMRAYDIDGDQVSYNQTFAKNTGGTTAIPPSLNYTQNTTVQPGFASSTLLRQVWNLTVQAIDAQGLVSNSLTSYPIIVSNNTSIWGQDGGPLPGDTALDSTLNLPASAGKYLNKTTNYSFSSKFYQSYVVETWMDGTMMDQREYILNPLNLTSDLEQNTTFLNTTVFGYHTYYVLIYDLYNLTRDTSASRTFEVDFAVSQLGPSNSSYNGTTITYSYNTTNYYPITCSIIANSAVEDSRSVSFSSTVTVTVPKVSGTYNWFVACQAPDNSTYWKNTTNRTYNFGVTNGSASFPNYTNVSLGPENVYAEPQALFYDLENNLNVLYYIDENASEWMRISTLNGSTITRTYYLKQTRGYDFIASFRLAANTTILTFNNTSARFATFVNGTIVSANIAGDFLIGNNTYFDPYTYAYTKQYSSLNIGNSSYYLFWLQNSSNTSLINMNATLTAGTSALTEVNNSAIQFSWQTLARNSSLTEWYYAKPNGTDPYWITIYAYNITNITEVATPDPNNYTEANISNSTVAFEAYGNKTYYIQFGQVSPLIYQLETGKNYTFNSTNGSMINPSNFYFVDEQTFIFFSIEDTATWAYSCYFGNTNATCNRISAGAYGISVPYLRGTMTTSKRVPNVLTGPQDVVTAGFIASGNVSMLFYNQYTYDLKMSCFDEQVQGRKLMNVRVFSDTTSIVMDVNTYLYGYVLPNSLLGTGTKKVYSYCISPTYGNGTSRMYVYNTDEAHKQDTFSLIDQTPNAYYTFIFTDCFAQPSRNSLLTSKRFMNDRQDYAIVEQAFTSLSGEAVLFMQPFVLYKLNILTTDGVNMTFDFTPSSVASVTIPVGCAGLNINTTPTKENEYQNLIYKIEAVTTPGGSVVTGGATNDSVNVSFNYSSPQNRIYSSNYLIWKSTGDGARILVYNSTDYASAGSRSFFINSTTGPATFDLVMEMQILKLSVNNTGLTYPLNGSDQLVTLTTRSSVTLTRYSAMSIDVRKNLQNAFKDGGGWAYIFIATILTMLLVGYVSRFTLDGAGLIGALFFLGLALLNPINIVVAGVVIAMWHIGAIALIAAFMFIIWRYV